MGIQNVQRVRQAQSLDGPGPGLQAVPGWTENFGKNYAFSKLIPTIAFRRVYDYTSTNYIKMVERTAAAAERVSTQSATAFGALRNRVRVPNILIPGPSVHDNQYYSNLRMVFEKSHLHMYDLRHSLFHHMHIAHI